MHHKLAHETIFSYSLSDWFNTQLNIPFDQSVGSSHGVIRTTGLLTGHMEHYKDQTNHRGCKKKLSAMLNASFWSNAFEQSA